MPDEIVGRVPEERCPALERTLAVAMRELALEELEVHVVDDDRVLSADVAAGAGLAGVAATGQRCRFTVVRRSRIGVRH